MTESGVSSLLPRMFPVQGVLFPVLAMETFHPEIRKQRAAYPLLARCFPVS